MKSKHLILDIRLNDIYHKKLIYLKNLNDKIELSQTILQYTESKII